MKVLVATKASQGKRRNDFCWADEGELVGFASECDGESIDGGCGCRRSFTGMYSRKGTTTAKVIEFEGTREDYVEVLALTNAAAWGGLILREESEREAEELLRIADTFDVGYIVEKRGDEIQTRFAHWRVK